MKYDYHFSTETISIDIPEGAYEVLIDLDRAERNNDQRETRRHVSLESLNLDETLLPSATDVESSCIRRMEEEALRRAMDRLLPEQREVIRKVFFEYKTIASVAREEGVGESAIRRRLSRAFERLKIFLK